MPRVDSDEDENTSRRQEEASWISSSTSGDGSDQERDSQEEAQLEAKEKQNSNQSLEESGSDQQDGESETSGNTEIQDMDSTFAQAQFCSEMGKPHQQRLDEYARGPTALAHNPYFCAHCKAGMTILPHCPPVLYEEVVKHAIGTGGMIVQRVVGQINKLKIKNSAQGNRVSVTQRGYRKTGGIGKHTPQYGPMVQVTRRELVLGVPGSNNGEDRCWWHANALLPEEAIKQLGIYIGIEVSEKNAPFLVGEDAKKYELYLFNRKDKDSCTGKKKE